MRGVRSAMTTSMLSWRDTASDMFFRTGQLRDGEQDGIWAKHMVVKLNMILIK